MSRARILGFVVVLVIVLVIVLVGGVKGGPYLWLLIKYYRHAELVAPRAEDAEADWRAAFGDPDALLASYARDDDNATAKRLSSLAKAIGIDLGAFSSAATFDTAAINTYVIAQSSTRSGTPPDAPTGDVRAYLEQHRAEIAAIVDLLATNDAPAWKCDMSGIVPQPGVGLMGLWALNDVLTARALYDASQGRAADADRAMRAAWQLLPSFRNQPQLIAELTGMRLAMKSLSLVRRLDADPGAWRARLHDYDYPAGVVRAVETETAVRARANRSHSMTSRAFRADYLDGMRADVLHMRTISLTDPLEPVQDMENLPEAAPGTVIARIAAAGVDRAWLTARGVMLDVELTDRVLEVQEIKAGTGRWPAALPDVASMQVPGAQWVYAVGADGGISISLNRSVPSIPQMPRFDAQR